MAKTAVSVLTAQIKRKFDYAITDSDLDDLIVDEINDSIIIIKQLLLDNNILQEISANAYIKTVEDQAYIDPFLARIVGDTASFTAVAGDTITVTIDGTAYTTAALTGAVLVATVVTAINLATVAIGDVASESDDGYLVITSLTSGATSSVTIADGAGTPASRLFTVAAERTQSAIADIDELIMVSERTNDTPITIMQYQDMIYFYPDPTLNYSTTPDYISRWNDRLYFAPTPNSNIYIYLDYIKNITAVTIASTMPFNSKYDPLIVAMCIDALTSWMDSGNAVAIAAARKSVDDLTKSLIVNATRNVGLRQNVKSRRESDIGYFAPRRVVN